MEVESADGAVSAGGAADGAAVESSAAADDQTARLNAKLLKSATGWTIPAAFMEPPREDGSLSDLDSEEEAVRTAELKRRLDEMRVANEESATDRVESEEDSFGDFVSDDDDDDDDAPPRPPTTKKSNAGTSSAPQQPLGFEAEFDDFDEADFHDGCTSLPVALDAAFLDGLFPNYSDSEVVEYDDDDRPVFKLPHEDDESSADETVAADIVVLNEKRYRELLGLAATAQAEEPPATVEESSPSATVDSGHSTAAAAARLSDEHADAFDALVSRVRVARGEPADAGIPTL